MALRILLSNDDGVNAPGLKAVARELRAIGDLMIVAPMSDQSGVSHSLTITRPLRIKRHDSKVYSVDGTPTDCMTIAMHEILKRPPQVVVSGINHGPNMGEDVHYSGTVAAAIEGTIMGIPSIAASMTAPDHDGRAFRSAAKFLRRLVPRIIGRIPKGTLLNVNFPALPKGGYRQYQITRLGHRTYTDIISAKRDPRGREYFWIGGEPTWDRIKDTDAAAVGKGIVSISPMNIDMTDSELLEQMRQWKLR
ncbi:MAG: 5'/3'-nucleotidase SurE [Candidatus Zixiibacteriota bacterium]